MTDKTKRIRNVIVGMAFVLAWLGGMLILFPVGNPMHTVKGTSGEGIFYLILIGVVLTLIILLLYAVRNSVWDVVQSLAKEVGLDANEIAGQYKKILRDEYEILMKRKEKISDSHDEA